MDSRLRRTLLRLRSVTSIHEAEARFDAFIAVVLSLPVQRRPRWDRRSWPQSLRAGRDRCSGHLQATLAVVLGRLAPFGGNPWRGDASCPDRRAAGCPGQRDWKPPHRNSPDSHPSVQGAIPRRPLDNGALARAREAVPRSETQRRTIAPSGSSAEDAEQGRRPRAHPRVRPVIQPTSAAR